MQDPKNTTFPELSYTDEFLKTRPLALQEIPLQARIDRELAVINKYHARIGTAILSFWGHKDCVEYIQKLILSGGDGVGHTRVGFKAEVVDALMSLISLHETQFK